MAAASCDMKKRTFSALSARWTAIFLFLSAALVIDVRTAASRFWNKLYVKSQPSQKSNYCRGARRRAKKTIETIIHQTKKLKAKSNFKFMA
jgi:hypothetical protein